MTVFETERLTLRWFEPDDAAFIRELVNQPGWLRFIGDRGVTDDATARAFIVDRLARPYAPGGIGFFAMIRRSDGERLGMCGLIRREGLDAADIGFALLERHEGQGYAREAAVATLVHARRIGLDRVLAITNPDNQRSQHLLQRLGLQFERDVKLPGESTLLKRYGMALPRDATSPVLIDKLGLLHIRDRRLLVARSHNKTLFYVPGGKRDPGESDLEALRREVREELATDLIAETIQPAGVFQAEADGREDGAIVRVTTYFGTPDSAPKASAEIAELAWFSTADMACLSLAGQLILRELKALDRVD